MMSDSALAVVSTTIGNICLEGSVLLYVPQNLTTVHLRRSDRTECNPRMRRRRIYPHRARRPSLPCRRPDYLHQENLHDAVPFQRACHIDERAHRVTGQCPLFLHNHLCVGSPICRMCMNCFDTASSRAARRTSFPRCRSQRVTHRIKTHGSRAGISTKNCLRPPSYIRTRVC